MKGLTTILGFLGSKNGALGILKDNDGKFAFKRALPMVIVTKAFAFTEDPKHIIYLCMVAAFIYVGGKLADALKAKYTK